MDLPGRWARLMDRIGARADRDAVYADLDRRYREPGRAYHTWAHVADCLAELDRASELSRRPEAVELALWFHDAVYDPRASDNEERSAALLREAGSRMGIGDDLAAAAAALVLATAHRAEPGLPAGGAAGGDAAAGDAALARDIDLAILGAPAARFRAYEGAVRREFRHVTDAEWRAGRSGVLAMFLELPRIYVTDAFRGRLEARARRNLAAGLRRLRRADA